ncbi:MAG: hypothetical protein AAF600_03270 [Bacteroidota bacterium]
MSTHLLLQGKAGGGLVSVPNVAIKPSPPSNTLFHQVKFPILKAYYIFYLIASVSKKRRKTRLLTPAA